MAKAVWRKNKHGRDTYIGHVPNDYKLKAGEYYKPLPNIEEVINPQLISMRNIKLHTQALLRESNN